MFKRGDRVDLEITDFAFGGKGIAKISSDSQRGIVFVPNTYPGQKVRVVISAKKKKHYEAKLIDIIERSPIEKINPYQAISGAPYIFVPVKEQERLKQESTWKYSEDYPVSKILERYMMILYQHLNIFSTGTKWNIVFHR